MKKDRNSFFSEYNMSSYNNLGPMMPNMYPNQVSSQSSFYSGPAIQDNMMLYNNQPMNNNTYTSDIESRISKIERQINRIETRLKNIESELSNNFNTNNDTGYNNNMYMV